MTSMARPDFIVQNIPNRRGLELETTYDHGFDVDGKVIPGR